MHKSYAYLRIPAGDKESIDKVNIMRNIQVSEENIFLDYPTKKDRKFPQYQLMLQKIQEGDLLYICKLSSLGDGYKEVCEQWRVLTREKKADIVVMDMPSIDTRRENSDYEFGIADIVLNMLEYVAASESNVRRSRQREGIVEAKERGIIFGRPQNPAPNFSKAYNQWLNKEISVEKAADMCGLSRTTFYRRAKVAKESTHYAGVN